jgi:DNA-binding response OmpR family regulator
MPATAAIHSWPDLPLAARHPPPTVLLIEPHADTRELYHLWLTQCGFVVTVAASCVDAGAAARRTGADVVVIEPMFEPDWVALIRALRADPICADAVVIVLTTRTDGAVRRQAVDAGADAYLTKPCGVGQLAEAIATASLERLRLVAPEPCRMTPSPLRLRQAVQRCRAIRERLAFEPVKTRAAGSGAR